jgi:hypothetical protein
MRGKLQIKQRKIANKTEETMNNKYYQQVENLAAKVVSSEDEISYLRELAAMTMELANEPRMATIKQRWRDVNALRKPDRPPIWCNPVGCWVEMIPSDVLICKNELNRELELYFRKIMIKRDIDDDSPVNPYFKVGMQFDVTPANIWGVDIIRESLDEVGTAWQYKSALQTYEDFDRLQAPQYHYNQKNTESYASQINDILDDVMPIQIVALPGYSNQATIGNPATNLRGMETLMLDMILDPKRVHQLMEIVFQGAMNYLDAIEATGNILPNTDEPMFLSDPLRPEPTDGKYSFKDCWMAGNSQELDQVSPDMFEDFLLNYQKKIFERFGAISYGCCENLTQKIDPVLQIPNLKIMVCSAWTNLELLVNKVNQQHCIMWRHLASDVVCQDDTMSLKKKINTEAKILQGCSYQAILRELQTLMGHPNRLHEWTEITKEAVSR